LSYLHQAITGDAYSYHTGEREAKLDGVGDRNDLHNLIIDEI